MKCAAIDLGTNSVLCLIATVTRDPVSPPLVVHRDLARITRLGQNLSQEKKLHPNAIARTLKVLGEYRREIQEAGVLPENTFVLATAGLRRAQNAREFIEMVKADLGLSVQVIDGVREAALTALGVICGLRTHLSQTETFLVMDIGGGSTELIRAEKKGGLTQKGVSLPLGSVWLTERYLQDSDPPTKKAYEKMLEEIHRVLEEAAFSWSDISQVVGVAGTVTTLAAMEQKLKTYDARVVHGSHLSQKALRKWVDTLRELPVRERYSIPGLQKERADVILAGAAIAEAVVEKAGCTEQLICDQGIRYGILYEQGSQSRL
jgi:exopolyphosphatase/guanosine-5'-triphosphate,3'-diphosphate pyrophosphatase